MEKLLIFSNPLEKINNYNEFNDFLDSFTFYKPNNKDPNSSVKEIEVGRIKGKFYIYSVDENKEGNYILGY